MTRYFKKYDLLIITSLILLQGILIEVLYWMEPSSTRNAWIGGLSRERFIIGGLFLLILAGLMGLIIRWVVRPENLRYVQGSLVQRLKKPFFRWMTLLACGLLLGVTGIYLAMGWWGRLDPTSFFNLTFNKIDLLAVWLALAALQGLALLLWLAFQQPETTPTHGELAACTLVLLACLLSGMQWLTLIFHLQWPYLFSQFIWTFVQTPYTLLHPLIWAAFTLFGAGLLFLPRSRRGVLVGWVLLAAWAYALQLLIPQISLSHTADVLQRYNASPISHVIYSVCKENPGYSVILRQYDSLMGNDFWLGTKPPGYMLFYTLLRDGAALAGWQDCTSTLPTLVMFLFPLLAVLTLLPLHALSRSLDGEDSLPLGVALLFSLPNVIFFTLIADQALYPFLFTLTLWLTVETTRRSSASLALLLGILLYLDIFVSFSLLPVLGFVGLWWCLALGWSPKNQRPRLLMLAAAAAFGFGLIFTLFLLVGGYNPWVRYLNAFSSHRSIKQVGSSPSEIASTILLNNVEFVYWIGFPLCLLALTRLGWVVWHNFKSGRSASAQFALSLLGMLIVLNLAGQTRGEVGRLWLFLTPCLALLASQVMIKWPRWGQAAVFTAQMVSLLCFFQAYYVP